MASTRDHESGEAVCIGLRVLQPKLLFLPRCRRPDFDVFALTNQDGFTFEAGELTQSLRYEDVSGFIDFKFGSSAKDHTEQETGQRVSYIQRRKPLIKCLKKSAVSTSRLRSKPCVI